jgi:hypothetical protein
VNLHAVFLRKGCILPDRLDPLQEPFGANWSLVKEILAPVFDTMIRQAGWHFMCVQSSCSRRGFGRTQEQATQRALACSLRGVSRRFNGAELEAVQVTKYPGFHIANVTLQPRRIQQHTSFDIANEILPQAVRAR